MMQEDIKRIMDQQQDLFTWMCLNHPRFVLSSLIESEISEQVRRQIATGEVIIMKKKLFTYIARVTYAHTHTRITI